MYLAQLWHQPDAKICPQTNTYISATFCHDDTHEDSQGENNVCYAAAVGKSEDTLYGKSQIRPLFSTRGLDWIHTGKV